MADEKELAQEAVDALMAAAHSLLSLAIELNSAITESAQPEEA